jgi:hypothetical protein
VRSFRFIFALAPFIAALIAAPANAADGLYVSATGNNSLMIVDSSTIAPDRLGHATAVFFEFRRDGKDARVTADFDCEGHRVRALSLHAFGLNAGGIGIWEGDIDPPSDYEEIEDGSVLRETELFICRWPGSVIGKAAIPEVPDDQAEQMNMLARSAKATFDTRKP